MAARVSSGEHEYVDCIQSQFVLASSRDTEVHLTMFDTGISSGSSLDRETATAILRFIRPRPEELSWQAIPWQTSIPDAIAIAQRERKPVLLWAMNGNPLGLT